MEKQIFKKGDKVFDYLFGWGNVVEVRDDNNRFPLRVQFKKGIAGYTFDGRFYEDSPQTLSFTEYTINGFSQERPVELPEIGKRSWLVKTVTIGICWRFLNLEKVVFTLKQALLTNTLNGYEKIRKFAKSLKDASSSNQSD